MPAGFQPSTASIARSTPLAQNTTTRQSPLPSCRRSPSPAGHDASSTLTRARCATSEGLNLGLIHHGSDGFEIVQHPRPHRARRVQRTGQRRCADLESVRFSQRHGEHRPRNAGTHRAQPTVDGRTRPDTAGQRMMAQARCLPWSEACLRRVWDSNPRCRSLDTAVFKTAALGHYANPPGVRRRPRGRGGSPNRG